MSEVCHITITDGAQAHFSGLIDGEKVEGMALRVFLDRPGSPKSEVGITFCPPGQEKATDIKLTSFPFLVYLCAESEPFLLDANIDYKTDALGGELSITAPNLRGQSPKEEAPLFERVTFFLNAEVNPHLANHGGMVSLVDITPEGLAVLQFGGGCHGCGMADVTLKEGIEKNLLENFPELTGLKDSTDHATGENPYF